MRLGLLVRADNRGLGIQTWELYRHLRPAVTVLVSMRHVRGHGGGQEYPARFPDALTVLYLVDGSAGFEPYEEALAALATCDTVLTVETPYDWRLLEDLPAHGVRTVVVGNREFLEWAVRPDLPRPNLFIAPSPWRLDEWPENTVLLPHPVDRERLPFRLRTRAGRFLHIAAPAMKDRAGTGIVLEASQLTDARIVVKAQAPLEITVKRPRRVEVVMHDWENYWDAYREGDVLVAPRRYGGQSLPVNEAMSLGMPVIALDKEPERSMLPAEGLVPAYRARDLHVIGGEIGLWDARPPDLAAKLTELWSSPELVEHLSRESDRRAEALSWDTLGPRWRRTLEEP